MNQRVRVGLQIAELRLQSAGRKFAHRVDTLEGFGLILFFWTLVLCLLGGLVFLFEGFIVWHSGLVLVGLLLLRCGGQLIVLGARHLKFFDI